MMTDIEPLSNDGTDFKSSDVEFEAISLILSLLLDEISDSIDCHISDDFMYFIRVALKKRMKRKVNVKK